MKWKDEQKQSQRAQAASLMMPWFMAAEVCAEQLGVEYEEIADATDKELFEAFEKVGITRESILEGFPMASAVNEEQLSQIADGLGIEKWFAENIRRVVREEEPLPFGVGVGGVFVDSSLGPEDPMVCVIATKLSDPDALSQKFLRMCKRTFGAQAFKDVGAHSPVTKPHRLTPEQMVAMWQRGLSYREIAIQSLRDQYPDIIARPERFKDEIKVERERVIKIIRAAQDLWKKRAPETSID